MKIWVQDAFSRIYPQTQPTNKKTIKVLGALNERQAVQVAVKNESLNEPLEISLSTEIPKEFKSRIRRIGYVPMPHLNIPLMESSDTEGLENNPGYVPDPLFDEKTAIIPPLQTHAFWVDIIPGKNAQPGRYQSVIEAKSDRNNKIHKLQVCAELADIKLKPIKNFRVLHWFYTDALIDWYKTDGYDHRFWDILPSYLKNMAEHGQDTVFVPIFTPPLDGIKTPCQLLKVKKHSYGKYTFDFSDVKKYIEMSKKSGLKYFAWSHLVTQWGARDAIRIYEGQGETGKLLWKPETKATSKIYKNFLSQFLPAWHEFLKSNNLLRKSYFHLSDEPDGEEHLKNYVAFRKLLKELAPWMKVIDALSDINFARAGLTDNPVAKENVCLNFLKEGIACWVYYCCDPRGGYLNHLLDTPLAKIAMHGLLFYRWDFAGFMHWGYNYWYRKHTTELIDPFIASDGYNWPEWPHGDPFLVYPGENGPIDSIRWEIFSIALQDYKLLEALAVSRDNKMLADIKSFEEFPKDTAWRMNFRKKVLNLNNISKENTA